jgi:3-dehydroquinate synthase II
MDLKVGDRVLGATAEAGRHFGVAVKETIVEK